MLETVGDTLTDVEGEVLELALGQGETLRVTVTLRDKEEEEDTVNERDDVGDWEGDLEGEDVTEGEMVAEIVRVPLEEALVERDVERVKLGERV